MINSILFSLFDSFKKLGHCSWDDSNLFRSKSIVHVKGRPHCVGFARSRLKKTSRMLKKISEKSIGRNIAKKLKLQN